MELRERIARRQSGTGGDGLVADWTPLSPAAHVAEPVGRGPTLERLLDALDPVFVGGLPSDIAVAGPTGSGKSAVVTALFSSLNDQLRSSPQAIGTTTRAGSKATPSFVYVDARQADSAFQLYHDLLDGVLEENVPSSGVGTSSLRERAEAVLGPQRRAVLAVDHLHDAESLSVANLRELLAPLENALSLVLVDRSEPENWAGETVIVPAYRQHAIVDIITERSSTALTRGPLNHELARRIAGWAEGNAHDALAVLFSAAVRAEANHDDEIGPDAVEAAIAAVPHDSVHLGRVLSLPDNRKEVLRALLAESDDEELSLNEVADRIAESTDLSPSTVTRFLYELAEDGILERVPIERSHQSGRKPSQVKPRFPTEAFQRLLEG